MSSFVASSNGGVANNEEIGKKILRNFNFSLFWFVINRDVIKELSKCCQ